MVICLPKPVTQVGMYLQRLLVVAYGIIPVSLYVVDIPDIGVVISFPYPVLQAAVNFKGALMMFEGACVIPPFTQDISDICIDIALTEPVSFCPVYLQCLFIIVHGLFVVSLEFVEDSETVVVVSDIKGPDQRLVSLQRLFK